jgi:hypothetical protein
MRFLAGAFLFVLLLPCLGCSRKNDNHGAQPNTSAMEKRQQQLPKPAEKNKAP